MEPNPEFIAHLDGRRSALRTQLAAILEARESIVWEVGSGHGHFLVQYAADHPPKFCVGVDLAEDRIARAERKATRGKLPNCRFVRCEAREFLAEIPLHTSIAEMWVLFPDPWPKKRHHKNRIMQSDFLEQVAGRAGEGTRLYFRTDDPEYFTAASIVLSKSQTWRILSEPNSVWPYEKPTVFQARAKEHQSLIAVRTECPAAPKGTPAPNLPRKAKPMSLA